MKKIILAIVGLFVGGTMFAQQLQMNPKPHLHLQKKQSVSVTTKTPVDTLFYCGDNVGANLGYGSPTDLTAMVYFPAATMSSYNGNYINKIMIGVDPSNLSGLEIRIWTDTSNFGANPAYTQTVDLSTLTAGWNTIVLTTPYAIDSSAIFVGYLANSNDYGLYADDQTADASGYADIIGDGSSWAHLADYNFGNWQIKAIVDDGAAFDDVACTNIILPNPQCGLTANETVTVTVQNLGTSDLTNSFDLAYTVNGGTVNTVSVPTPLAVGATVDVDLTIDMSASGQYDVVAYTSLSTDANNDNDTIDGITVHTDPSVVPFGVQFDPATGDFLGWFSEDVNGDGSTWGIYGSAGAGYGHNDDYAAIYQYNSANAADDYLYSNCIDLSASQNYTLTFWYKVQSDSYPEKLKVMLGASPASSAMTTEIIDLGTITDTVWTQATATFTVPSDGTYNLGFYAYSDADMWLLYVDDINVEIATSVNEINTESISVYPTLTKGIVHISVASDVEVYSQLGQLVKTANNVNSIDLSSMNAGVYFVKVSNKNGSVMKKVVLTK